MKNSNFKILPYAVLTYFLVILGSIVGYKFFYVTNRYDGIFTFISPIILLTIIVYRLALNPKDKTIFYFNLISYALLIYFLFNLVKFNVYFPFYAFYIYDGIFISILTIILLIMTINRSILNHQYRTVLNHFFAGLILGFLYSFGSVLPDISEQILFSLIGLMIIIEFIVITLIKNIHSMVYLLAGVMVIYILNTILQSFVFDGFDFINLFVFSFSIPVLYIMVLFSLNNGKYKIVELIPRISLAFMIIVTQGILFMNTNSIPVDIPNKWKIEIDCDENSKEENNKKKKEAY